MKRKIARRVSEFFREKLSYEQFRKICIKNVSRIKPDGVDFAQKYALYLNTFSSLENQTETVTLNDIGFYVQRNGGKNIKYLVDRGWTEEEIRKEFSELSKKSKNSIANFEEVKKKYGRCNRFETYLTRVNPNTGKFYSESEAILLIREKQRKASSGKKRKIEEKSINVNMFSDDFWISRGLSDIEAKEKIELLKRKIGYAATLEAYIEKYGVEKGKEKFYERQIRWQNSLNSKTDEEKLLILQKKCKKLPQYSKQSIRFFDRLIEKLQKHSLEFFLKDSEMHIWDSDTKKLYFYDFVIRNPKIVVEFNGAHCHPSPRLTDRERKEWKCPYTKMNAETKTAQDCRKKKVAISKGFYYEEVWTDMNLETQLEDLVTKINYYIEKATGIV